MKQLLKELSLVIGIITVQGSITANAAPLWTKTFQCQEYTVILSENPKKTYNYQAYSSKGNINLSQGRVEETGSGQVFVFKNKGIEYWVTDGTLDANVSGVLEVYQDRKQILLRNCR